jgi:hypothetical protein
MRKSVNTHCVRAADFVEEYTDAECGDKSYNFLVLKLTIAPMIEIWNDDGDLDLEQWVKANVLASLVSNR